jgi:DNA (cytosine-5)-methyltransferase 1
VTSSGAVEADNPSRLSAVSLFSNCGAGDLGYREAGFSFDVMAELDPRRLSVALDNHPGATGVQGDLTETWLTVVSEWRKKHGQERPALLAACPPCQGMSSARSGRGKQDDHIAGGRDSRNLLVTVIAEVARKLRPRVIVVENVQAFLTRAVPNPSDGSPISAALLLVDELSKDYVSYSMVADLADWGVPQSRTRAFLTLVRRDELGLKRLRDQERTPFPRPTHARDYGGQPITLRESLLALNPGKLDARSKETAVHKTDELHRVPVWEPMRYRMVQEIPVDFGATAWQNRACSQCAVLSDDPRAAVCSSCGAPLLRPVVQAKDGWRLVKGFKTSSYARMRADAPSSTITTASGHVGSDKTIHPWENRVLSIRECAHLQTLPKDFKWGDALAKWGHTNVRQMIGEAVPPAFTRQHGKALVSVLRNSSDLPLLVAADQRALKADRALEGARKKARAFKEELLKVG